MSKMLEDALVKMEEEALDIEGRQTIDYILEILGNNGLGRILANNTVPVNKFGVIDNSVDIQVGIRYEGQCPDGPTHFEYIGSTDDGYHLHLHHRGKTWCANYHVQASRLYRWMGHRTKVTNLFLNKLGRLNAKLAVQSRTPTPTPPKPVKTAVVVAPVAKPKMPVDTSALTTRLEGLKRELKTTEREIRTVREELAMWEGRRSKNARLQTHIEEKTAEIEEILSSLHRDFVVGNPEIEALRAEIAETRGKMKPINETAEMQVKNRVSTLNNKAAALRSEIEQTQKAIKEIKR